jgi:hypothetical protein
MHQVFRREPLEDAVRAGGGNAGCRGRFVARRPFQMMADGFHHAALCGAPALVIAAFVGHVGL